MISKGLELIKTEWKLTLFFLLLILFLGCVPIFIYNAILLNFFLYALGLDLYNGYFSILDKKLKGQQVANEYKSLIYSKDKNGSDFLILIVFFGAILLIFKGPMILFNFLFAEKANEFISSSEMLLFLLSILFAIAGSAYKISIYAAAASLKYYNNEVIDSFKTGIKGIWKFKFFVIFFCLYNILVSFLDSSQSPNMIVLIKLLSYIIPSFLMVFMISNYHLESLQKEKLSAPNKDIEQQ